MSTSPAIPGVQSLHCSRRTFLASGAAILGLRGTDGIGLAADEPRTPWRMKLACSSIAFASLSIEEAVTRIAALGFDAIDIWSAHAGCPHLDDVLDRLGPESLRQLLASHQLDLYAFSVYRGGYPRYAELLGNVGGGIAVRGSMGISSRENLSKSMKHFLESLAPELALAEKYDSYLAIENHSGTSLLNWMDSLKAFTDLNRHPRLGIALAPYHIQVNSESVEEAIQICGDQLLFFYAWQNASATGQLPGIGPTDCSSWVRTLSEVGFRHPVTPFMHHQPAPDETSQAMAKSCRYLRSCYKTVMAAK